MSGGARTTTPSVAVFDLHLPTGIGFVRSLARAGIAVTGYSWVPRPAGGYSRYLGDVRPCPPPAETDRFSAWLREQVEDGPIELVAPTSDWISFHLAELADVGAGRWLKGSVGDAAGLRNCLFKDRFARAMSRTGFPVPAWAAPRSVEEAVAAGEELGYPLVLKPRSHVGVGLARGAIARDAGELRARFAPFHLGDGHTAAVRHDPDLSLPLVQRFHRSDDIEVVSISGCIGLDGEVLALSHCRKVRQWPPRFGVGTLFEALPPQPFTEQAVDAVRTVMGGGVFELEVLVDDRTGEHWAIDLNPRAFGQMSLDRRRGCDLPMQWYRSVAGLPVERQDAAPGPLYWRSSVPLAAELAVRTLGGPGRSEQLGTVRDLLRVPSVGAAFDWSDPLPALALGAKYLRHPGGLLRPYLRDVE
jgi:D-aspartate ligase